jgi:hypothetical protein
LATVAPSTGLLTLAGKLADGTSFTGSFKPDAEGRYRVFVKTFASPRLNSYLSGRLNLVKHPDTVRFGGSYYMPAADSNLVWEKSPSAARSPDKSYRAGFGPLDLQATLDPWLPPVVASGKVQAVRLAQRLGLSSDNVSSGTLAVDHLRDLVDLGGLETSLPTSISLSVRDTISVLTPVTTPANVTKWTMSVIPATGAFSGSFTLSDVVPPATSRSVSFSGVLRQGPSGEPLIGAGFYLVPSLNGISAEQAAGGIEFKIP